jgi:hypothetical protein
MFRLKITIESEQEMDDKTAGNKPSGNFPQRIGRLRQIDHVADGSHQVDYESSIKKRGVH